MNRALVPTRGQVLWTLAIVVVVHAAIRRFHPEGAYGLVTIVLAALGALLQIPGCAARGRLREPLIGAAVLAGVGLPATFLLDTLVSAIGKPGLVHGALVVLIAVVAFVPAGQRVLRLVAIEWLKLWNGRLLKGGVLVAVLFTLLVGMTHEHAAGESGWSLATVTVGAGFWTAEILLMVMGAIAIAGEIGQGTMKMILPHAYLRSDWIAAKSLVVILAAIIFALFVAGAGVGYAAATDGLGDVVKVVPVGFGDEDEVQVFQTAAVMRSHLLETLTASTFSLMASALLGILLSCLFTSVVPALSASFLLFIALKVGDLFLGFSSEVLDRIYAKYPEWLRDLTGKLGRGYNERWDEGLLPEGIYLAVITGTLALLCAMRLFSRRDLHV